MDFAMLTALRRNHPGWRLLAAEHAPLIIHFLSCTFIQPNIRTASQAMLRSSLEDTLFQLREQYGDEVFPRSAAEYLDEWADDRHAWLRKFYPSDSNEPHFDLTASSEKAINWVLSLQHRAFVATESRLLTVFELLRSIVEGTTLDSDLRIRELQRRRSAIDEEIAQIRGGDLPVLDTRQVKDRFLQMEETARALLSDFREVEHNFRVLDRSVRERMATWEGGKAEVLSEIFGNRDAINDSDQGRTFRAFWDFLMSPARQEEFTSLLETVLALEAVVELSPNQRLRRIHYDWLEAGDSAQRTVARLSEQLRRYLDDQTWVENQRVMRLIRDIEQRALALRDVPLAGIVAEIDGYNPSIGLPMDRPLFAPPFRIVIADAALLVGVDTGAADALFAQPFVDKTRLSLQISQALGVSDQVSLRQLINRHPLEQGVAELVTYLSIAAEDHGTVIDDSHAETISWADPHGRLLEATVPLVVFSRSSR